MGSIKHHKKSISRKRVKISKGNPQPNESIRYPDELLNSNKEILRKLKKRDKASAAKADIPNPKDKE